MTHRTEVESCKFYKIETPESAIEIGDETCSVCLHSEKQIRNHDHLHKSGKKFEFPFCLLGFDNDTEMRLHKERHGGLYECRQCNLNFINLNSLAEHIPLCKPRPSQIADSETIPSQDTTVSCEVCFKKVITPSKLALHVGLHTSGDTYECCFCFLGFRDVKSLNEHKLTHDTKKPYECEVCKAKFKNSPELMSHFMETRHKEISNTVSEISLRKIYEPVPINKPNSEDLQCNICNARSTAPTKLLM